MISFNCTVCRSPLQAEDEQAGQLVRCPSCRTALRVPARETAGVGAASTGAGRPQAPPRSPPASFTPPSTSGTRGAGKRYGFNCAYCSSRLEATEAQAAQEGSCPTCGNMITIPILDRYGRLIDPKTRQIIKQDPHPVHAYAAAGDRAPRIVRKDKGQFIICPRCSAQSPITSNNCKSCGMPFTMDGTTVEASGSSNGFCVASLVLGIIGIPASCMVFPPALAIIFGVIGFNQVSRSEGAGGRGMAIAGIILGGIGAVIALLTHLT